MSVLDDIDTMTGRFEDDYTDKIVKKVMERIIPHIKEQINLITWEKVSVGDFFQRIDQIIDEINHLKSDIDYVKYCVESQHYAGYPTHNQIHLG